MDGREPIAVGSAGWRRWLDARTSTTLRIEDAEPVYAARRESRGSANYWYGYRRRERQLRKVYLGRSTDLTAERLQEVAELLADASDEPCFVGRGESVLQVVGLLRRSRAVALVGPGGIGKSRLAAAVGRARERSLHDGVHVVALAAGCDGDLLASGVARAMGLPDRGASVLADAIGQRQTLIVLDACEHAVTAVAALMEHVLSRCRGVRFLATSRVPVPVAAAITWRVPPLDVPHEMADAAALLGTGAGRLLRARARLADPCFAVTDGNAAALAWICRRLDGVPLALELAAARLGVLPAEALAARLDAGVAALDTADHRWSRVVHDVVTWSYEQLDEHARVVFARLAVFAGSWSLDAAEVVCSDVDSSASPVVAQLAVLVELSLVHTAAGRYRMLGIVRRFAEEVLVARGEYDAVHDRHAAFQLARAEQADPMGYDRSSEKHRRDLNADADDLRAALRWLVEQGNVHAARRMGIALAQFWEANSALREGRLRLDELLDIPGDPPARLLVGAGLLAALDGDYPDASSLLDRALEHSRQEADPVATANCLYLIGLLSWWRRDYAGAGAAAADGERVGLAAGRPGLVGLNVWTRAQVAATCGDSKAAWRLAQRALRLCADADHPLGVAQALNLMGQVALDRGECDAAHDLLQRALAECRTFGWPALELATLLALSRTALGRGDLDAAQTWAAQGLVLARDRLGPSRLCQPLEAAALIAAARHQWTHCLRLAEGAATLRDRHRIVPTPAERSRLAAAVDRARAAVGPARSAAAMEDGRATLAQAVLAEALHGAVPDPSIDRVEPGRLPPLTARQSEIARLVAEGLSNKQLATHLQLAEATVERHLVNIYRTLDIGSRTRLAAWVTSAAR